MRPNFVAAYLIDPHAQPNPLILLLKRSPFVYLGGIWQIVTGKVEGDESILQSVRREVVEETGLIVHKVHKVNVSMFYESGKDEIGFSANFLIFVDHKQNVVLSTREHSEFVWCSINKAIDLLAFSQQKELLVHIERYYLMEKPNSASLINLDQSS